VSASAVAIAVEGLLVALALLFVLALLRSHAEILRRLSRLEGVPGGIGGRQSPGREGAGEGGPARDIAGQTLAGDAVKLSLRSGSSRTLVAFLSSGCAACEPLWSGLRGPPALPADARLVVLTKSPDRERLARLRELAPADAEVVMSTQAWEDFAVPATPHFVLVGGSGEILGRGSATSWQQIVELLRDAEDDSALYRARARSTEQRASRAEQALTTAGIGPGHPSLYPSHQAPEEEDHE
jgi:hypothetical protein